MFIAPLIGFTLFGSESPVFFVGNFLNAWMTVLTYPSLLVGFYAIIYAILNVRILPRSCPRDQNTNCFELSIVRRGWLRSLRCLFPRRSSDGTKHRRSHLPPLLRPDVRQIRKRMGYDSPCFPLATFGPYSLLPILQRTCSKI